MAHGQRLQQSKILQLVVDYVRSSQQGKEMSRGTGKKGKGNLYFIGVEMAQYEHYTPQCIWQISHHRVDEHFVTA